jgi:hypothetical protein
MAATDPVPYHVRAGAQRRGACHPDPFARRRGGWACHAAPCAYRRLDYTRQWLRQFSADLGWTTR